MKIKVIDPIRRQLELAETECDLSDIILEHYKGQYDKLKERVTKLAVAKRNERKKLEDKLAKANLHNRLLLVILGELLVIATLGLSR